MKDSQHPKLNTDDTLVLKLYVSGMSPNSMEAIENIKKLCDDRLKNGFELEIIDLYKNPEAAKEHQIIFSPSLIKISPLPKKILIGTFHDAEKVITVLGLSIKE
ncbi:circadian clock protein KaiB [Algoriphagus ratkowskyi]|uniref:Circadian clock protein KaiB n=1 Tax=Algoriphagus ratkowskyi TaxID=57028 RepID=A0A2W7RAV9_9BACT|nr:circadian clock KaiB family protein [Algoriphagus ratkowskyi]PZX58223.1 circadian clock protein KaiB [Algoriphagus ratkowskyi]TXD77895.1 circadian clock protein KaiB [Algoriphagus ratkowskyi]